MSERQHQYGTASKREWRTTFWASVRLASEDSDSPINMPSVHVLMLPALNGNEVECALNSGIRAEHIHVVDKNPAVVATLKRRFPRINTYGVELDVAVQRMAKDGVRITVASLDLCSNISQKTRTLLTSIFSADCWAPSRLLVGVTLLRGRENQAFMRTLRRHAVPNPRHDIETAHLSKILYQACRGGTDERIISRMVGRMELITTDDIMRLREIAETLIGGKLGGPMPGPLFLFGGIYRNSLSTMLWSLWEAYPSLDRKPNYWADALVMAHADPHVTSEWKIAHPLNERSAA